MITSFLESHPGIGAIFGGLGWLLTLVFEMWVGERRPLNAASSLKLLWTVIRQVMQHFQKQKGTNIMANTSANTNARIISVSVDGPTYDLGATILEAANKLLGGEKPQQVLVEELVPLMGQMSALAQIPVDFTGDRASVLSAAVLRAVQLEEMVRLHPAVAVVPALVSK